MPRSQVLESMAWVSLDDYCKRNPKPRLTHRMKHRCKLWLISTIADYVPVRDGSDPNALFRINDEQAERMVEYAKRTLNDE